jgi:LPS O-antigen subunit length determinant protein (WzzB/FepE family)
MGLLDDAKDAAEATGKKVGEWADDAQERLSDKVDELQADAEVAKAERERDATHAKNDYKEELRKD